MLINQLLYENDGQGIQPIDLGLSEVKDKLAFIYHNEATRDRLVNYLNLATGLNPSAYKDINDQIIALTKTIIHYKNDPALRATPPSLTKFLYEIEKQCSDIITMYKMTNKFLYRGLKVDKNVTSYYGTIVQNRRPRDSNEKLSDLLNKILRKTGIAARRDNSIFVTSDLDHAAIYGPQFIIFPKNGFKYTYSEQFKDIILSKNDTWKFFNPAKVDYISKVIQKFGWDDVFYYTDHRVTPKGFLKTSLWNNDMDYVKEAIFNKKLPMALLNLIDVENLIDESAVIDNLGLVNTNLKYAIQNPAEIWIHGEYYAISHEFEMMIRNVLGLR